MATPSVELVACLKLLMSVQINLPDSEFIWTVVPNTISRSDVSLVTFSIYGCSKRI